MPAGSVRTAVRPFDGDGMVWLVGGHERWAAMAFVVVRAVMKARRNRVGFIGRFPLVGLANEVGKTED